MQLCTEGKYDLLANISCISYDFKVVSHFPIYMNACVLITGSLSHFLMWLCQSLSPHTTLFQKKGKKKDKAAEEESDLEIMPMIDIIYEDTKAIIGAELEFKWGQIYPMIKDQKVPDVVLEDIPLYENILRSRITKVSTPLELFPCAEVIG